MIQAEGYEQVLPQARGVIFKSLASEDEQNSKMSLLDFTRRPYSIVSLQILLLQFRDFVVIMFHGNFEFEVE